MKGYINVPLATIYHLTLIMTKTTFNRRYDELLRQINDSAYQAELLNLMSQQLLDDTPVVKKETFKKRSLWYIFSCDCKGWDDDISIYTC